MDTQQEIIKANEDAAKAAAELFVKTQNSLFDQIAELRAKIIDNTATDADKKKYFELKQQISKNEETLSEISKIDPADAQKIKDDYRKQKLARLSGSAGSITSAKPGDLFEYVLRTQALNPYARERACDIEFMDLLYVVSKDTGTDLAKVKKLMATVREAISAN